MNTKYINFSRSEIKITPHAEIRMIHRQINKEEVLNNLHNPRRLDYAIKEKTNDSNVQKFDCYFGYSKTQCHRYVLIIGKDILIITVIKINRRWQKLAESKLKRNN